MASEKIDILLLGAGGREHALLMKLAESPRAGKLYVAPGNGGMLQLAEAAPVDQENAEQVASWAAEHGIGLVVIGPEAPLVVGVDVDAGLPFDPRCYETGRLGTDRALDCIAAIEKYGPPFLILDFGTATTIDAVGPDGVYVGGTIGPGLQVSLDALVSRTAMLPRVELQMPPTVLGRNTVEQIQVGVVAGYVGNMEYLIRRSKEEMGCDNIKVIATGGLSRMIARQTKMIDIVDTGLTLDGLQMVYDRNRDAKPIEIKNDGD